MSITEQGRLFSMLRDTEKEVSCYQCDQKNRQMSIKVAQK